MLPAFMAIQPPGFATVSLYATAFVAIAAAQFIASRENRETNNRVETLRHEHSTAAHFRSVIKGSADGFMVVDRDCRILEFSQSAETSAIEDLDDVVGLRFFDLLTEPEDQERAITLFVSLWDNPNLTTGVSESFNFTNRAGNELHFRLTAWIDVDTDACEPRMNVLMRDESVRVAASHAAHKAKSAEREALLRLEEVNAVQDHFVASISHELRSPLTSTLGYLEILTDGDAGELNEQQIKMIETAARNARRLKILIEDILTLSRIESGAFRVQFRPVDVASVMVEVLENNTLFARDRSVNLSIAGHPNAGFLAGDRKELVRAIDNIVNNAVKFTPPGGSVDIDVARNVETISFVIKDNGIGIPEGEHGSLFDRFFRASTAVAQQHPGAGLGLTIAKAIFEHHGGNIRVASDVDSGTQVTVELPALAGIEAPMSASVIDCK